MTVFRCIAPDWLMEQSPELRKVREGKFTQAHIEELNTSGYNIYYLPNYPSIYERGVTVEGSQIDTFQWVFIDMDLKDGTYPDKEAFLAAVGESDIQPTRVVDSGGGIHVYWQVSDLDVMSYLKLSRRLMRRFRTDSAVGQIYQLMRYPGTVNTKDPDNYRLCESIHTTDKVYTCEELDALLPPLTHEDEQHCKQHFEKTYKLSSDNIKIDDKLPLKFSKLIAANKEVKEIWSGQVDDRSKSDYRLGHVMFGNGFTREEATSVLVNSAKALTRAPVHRLTYALNIIDKIWTFEEAEDKQSLTLSSSVRDILSRSGTNLKGTRFPCWKYLDDTEHGFRLGQVIGLVGGSGIGKTAIALNMFMGFVQNNPDCDHFFVSLEQPANEIADRWRSLCGEQTSLHDRVHVISNYNEDGSYRNLSFDDLKDYALKYRKITGRGIGCFVIDHIGALKKSNKDGRQSIEDICHQMKAFAVQTNCLLVMQSQAPREKAGIGDLELNKDAAYGTVFFESYVDYLVTLWQPLKRCYAEGAPTVTAFKFCKIRHKNQKIDKIQEDVRYLLMFDPGTQMLRELTQNEEKSFEFFNSQCANLRKSDRKTEVVPYKSAKCYADIQNVKAS